MGIILFLMKLGVSSEQGSPKSRVGGLVAGHQSFICGQLHRPSGLQGQRFVRFRIGFTCCEFRPGGGMHLEFGSGLRACCARLQIRYAPEL